jgi:hypothetical protein
MTSTIHTEFVQAYGNDALRTVAAVIAWGHVRSLTSGQEQYGEVGEERCGVLRWLQIDSDLMKLKGRFPGVDISWVDNDCGKHIEIAAGQFRLLVAHDRNPGAVVPLSVYGKTLARTNTLSLFQDFEEPRSAGQFYYCVLFHSKSDQKGQVPDFLEVRFPAGGDRGTEPYAERHLRLYTLFPEIKDERWLLAESLNWVTTHRAKEETIVEHAIPKLRETGKAS